MTLRCLLLVLLLALPGSIQAADLFGRPETPPAAAPLLPALSLPAPLRSALGSSLVLQSRLNAGLRRQLGLVRDGASWRPALLILLLSFAYGVLHAVGPGHGKMVVGSYFLTRRANILQGVAMSCAAALSQALAAIALVGIAAWALGQSGGRLMAEAAYLEIASYGAIVLVGLWMAWGAATGRECCHAPAQPQACGCGDDPAHAAHRHGQAHRHHEHRPPARRSLSRLLAVGASVGLRPCSGAILVLLFTLANGIFMIGVLATLAMAAGVAITVSLVGLGGLALQRRQAGLMGRRPGLARAIPLVGAVVIIFFGLLQLAGIATGVITPMAG